MSPSGKKQGLNTSMSKTNSHVVSGANSPMKKSMKVTTSPHKVGEKEEEKRLSSPTSVSMQNSFIIKNADESFD